MEREPAPKSSRLEFDRSEAAAGDAGQWLVLGIGTGRCGTHTLADLLNRQPDAYVTHEKRPLLSWNPVPGRPGIRERLARFRRNRPQRLIGDVALFYLPYVEEAIALEPRLRVICLERPREEVVASFCRWLDAVHPLPTNHWAARPSEGWHHDPLWTRAFPQYEISDRAEGIRRYWEEYHRRAAELALRFPANVRVFPIEALNDKAGVRCLLSFAGVPEDRQVLLTGLRSAATDQFQRQPHPRQAALAGAGPNDPRRCVVLVPGAEHIAPACTTALSELKRRGYTVRRSSDTPLDQRWSRMATVALIQGFEETMWIDPDLGFDPDAVERLRSRGVPIVCGIDSPAQRSQIEPGCPTPPEPPGPIRGASGLEEVADVLGKFLLIRRQVYMDIQRRLDLPVCDEHLGSPLIPFFQPALFPWDEGWSCQAGGQAFCESARRCGYRLLADTTEVATRTAAWYGRQVTQAMGQPSGLDRNTL